MRPQRRRPALGSDVYGDRGTAGMPGSGGWAETPVQRNPDAQLGLESHTSSPFSILNLGRRIQRLGLFYNNNNGI